MRILLLTPNTTEAITDRLMGAARLVASVGTEIIPATAPRPRGRFRGRASRITTPAQGNQNSADGIPKSGIIRQRSDSMEDFI